MSRARTTPATARHEQAPEVRLIYGHLRRALRHGLHPAQMVTYSRPLICLLTSDQEKPVEDQAMQAEETIRAAIRRIGGDKEEALTILLGLAPGYTATKVETRRKAAARKLGIQPDTFRRPRHQRVLLLQIAMELYRDRKPQPE